ncbi:Synaptojanin-2-binding protein [Nibea albiflora]|uniref:Synaptojanin-2-binding protein n=1 Tax=Nibea albiflora TaxID=240163 RepID=A0ACB7FFJ3_NIBAL|nr:Synaptojanin-2-binding protein [Nibea albiflora]
MNGSVQSSSDAVDIKLKRGPAGLGFNIVGGLDQQYVVNDCGIYVSKIKEDGAAGLDGRLQEGDKILALSHHMNGPTGSQPDHDSSSTLGILAVVAGAAAIFAFIYLRHLKKHF